MNSDANIMGWDDAIEDDGKGFLILPEGDYNFEVTNFERGSFPGSAKIPACNKASLTLQVKTDDGVATVFEDLIMYRTLEWRISAFFRSIGLKKHGEKLTVNWNKIVGCKGRAHFAPHHYTDKNGNDRETNQVTRYIDYDEKNFPDEDEWMEVPQDGDSVPFFNGGE